MTLADSVTALSADIVRLSARVTTLERLAGLPPQADAVTSDSSRRAALAALERLRQQVARLSQVREAAWRHIPSIPPIREAVLSSPYVASRFHPLLHRSLPHLGVDLAAPLGTPILATADGVVTVAGDVSGYGLALDIDHENGFITRYAHALRLVARAGSRVHRGDIIAYVGSSGISTGPHLHYEIFQHGWSVDPSRIMTPLPLADLSHDPE